MSRSPLGRTIRHVYDPPAAGRSGRRHHHARDGDSRPGGAGEAADRALRQRRTGPGIGVSVDWNRVDAATVESYELRA